MVKIIARRILTTQSKSHSLHQNFPFPPCPSNAIWKTLACFTFQSRGVEIISTQLSVWLWTVTQFNTPKNEMTLMLIFLKIFSVWLSLFVLLFFVVTPCLAVVLQPCMEWIPVLKKMYFIGQLAGKKSPKSSNYQQVHLNNDTWARNFSLQFHVLDSVRSQSYPKTIWGWSCTCFKAFEELQ